MQSLSCNRTPSGCAGPTCSVRSAQGCILGGIRPTAAPQFSFEVFGETAGGTACSESGASGIRCDAGGRSTWEVTWYAARRQPRRGSAFGQPTVDRLASMNPSADHRSGHEPTSVGCGDELQRGDYVVRQVQPHTVLDSGGRVRVSVPAGRCRRFHEAMRRIVVYCWFSWRLSSLRRLVPSPGRTASG
jgi:hypothetical protein